MRLTARIDDELIIGKQGENGAVTVSFPVSSIFKEFGKQGEFVVLHRRAEDEASYPCEAVLNGDTVEWTVSNADNAQVGMGQLELRYIVNGRTVKSPTWRTRVLPALEEPTDIPPEPYESWVDNVTAAGAAAVQAKEAIVNMSVYAQQTDSASVNKSVDAAGNVQLNFGIPRGLPGRTPRKGVDYFTNAEINAFKAEVTPVKGRDYRDGRDGHTPVKGVDYFTDADLAEIAAKVPYDDSEIKDELEKLNEDLVAKVSDVKINGTALAKTDGAVEIPIAQINGGNGQKGVIGVQSVGYGGGLILSNGYLRMYGASESQILTRTSAYFGFLPSQLDLIVKAALTDGKGGKYTRAEQLKALEFLGAEFPVSIPTGANVPDPIFTYTVQYDDEPIIFVPSTPLYKYCEIRFNRGNATEFPISPYIYINGNYQQVSGSEIQLTSSGASTDAVRRMFILNGFIFSYSANIPPSYLTTTSLSLLCKAVFAKQIDKITIRTGYEAAKIRAGMKIEIYGV